MHANKLGRKPVISKNKDGMFNKENVEKYKSLSAV